jgi:ketosteroid isomerase-like protein
VDQLNLTMRGGAGDRTKVMAEDYHFVISGQPPACVETKSLNEIKQMQDSETFSLMEVGDPDFGIYIEEFIGDGNRMAALARSRGETTSGLPYLNTYLFVFEVRDGKLVELIEDCDSSLSATHFFDLEMVQA